jgi:hypothetical protein
LDLKNAKKNYKKCNDVHSHSQYFIAVIISKNCLTLLPFLSTKEYAADPHQIQTYLEWGLNKRDWALAGFAIIA